jgi:hypothetical protein
VIDDRAGLVAVYTDFQRRKTETLAATVMRYSEMSPAGKAIYMSGALIGIAVGCVALWYSPVRGIIPAAICGVIGVVFGMLVARPFAVRASRGRTKK